MSTTQRVFSETTLLNIRSKIDSMMFGDRVDLQYKARVGALTETMPKIMTANVTPFKDKKKNKNNCSLAPKPAIEIGNINIKEIIGI